MDNFSAGTGTGRSDPGDFISRLESALQEKREYLDTIDLVVLKDQFRVYQGAFKGIYNVLVKKSLINEDPYKYDKKISEVVVPPAEAFQDSTSADDMGIRLSDFDLQIDFLINYYNFNTEFLTLKRIRNVIGLLRFIQWDKISPTSGDPNTQMLAILFGKLKTGADPLSSGILADSQKQLIAITSECMGIIKRLTSFHREQYKYEVRSRIMGKLAISPESYGRDPEGAERALKKVFMEQMQGSPYYAELVKEIFMEDFSPGGAQLREAAIANLSVVRKEEQQTSSVNYKETLLDAVRNLTTASLHLEQALMKTGDNHQKLENRKSGIGSKFRVWIQKLVGGKEKKQVIELKIEDKAANTITSTRIEFEEFMTRAYKHMRKLSSLSNKLGKPYEKLSAAPEEQVYTFLDRILNETQSIHRILPALDSRFKAISGTGDDKVTLRGIRLELNGIKNAIMKCNQLKHEYLSRKEEQEQLKKLGMS